MPAAALTVRVVMTRSSEWDSAFGAITKAGCLVHVFADSSTALYIHEKLILDDPGTTPESMLIGSQNASVTSLTRNRELGILLTRANGGGKRSHDRERHLQLRLRPRVKLDAAKP